MKRLALAVATLLCLLVPMTASAAPAVQDAPAAYNPLGAACTNPTTKDSVACNTTGKDPISGPNGVIKKVTIVIALIAGIAAVIVIIISGLRMVFSGGDAKKAADARSALIGAIVGLVIIAAAQAIIIFVVSKV